MGKESFMLDLHGSKVVGPRRWPEAISHDTFAILYIRMQFFGANCSTYLTPRKTPITEPTKNQSTVIQMAGGDAE